MAEINEQVKPLAPATHSHRIDIHKHDSFPVEFTLRRRQKCIKCCGCSAALLLVLVVTVLILMLTEFHIKDPVLKLKAAKFNGLDLLSGENDSGHGRNLTLVAVVSVKNPNAASFKFYNITTNVYYDGSVVGEMRTPEGRAGARRTLDMNVSVDVMVDKLLGVGRFRSDLSEGDLVLGTYTRMSGKVKITDVIKKSFVVTMNCTVNVNVNVSSQVVQDRNCRSVRLS